MPTAPKWEAELDTIADAIRAGLQQDGEGSDDQKSHTGARNLRLWYDELMGLLERCQRENDVEGISEVVDVAALLLKACADGQWKQFLHEHPEEARCFFLDARLEMILLALATIYEADEDADDYTLATDIVASLLFIAITVEHAEAVLEALQMLPANGSVRRLLLNDTLPSGNESWNERFVRFVMLFISSPVKLVDDTRDIVEMLTGCDDNQWINKTWETKWHLQRSASIGRSLLGSTEQCVASVRRVFDGLTIPPVDPTTSTMYGEAAAVMNLLHADGQRGLQHGVDVTFIKAGKVHPAWMEGIDRDRAVCTRDVDDALRDGYTIGVRGMQARSLPVYTLCESLQSKLGQHVNANLYWTPPDEQGFDKHVDDHCVFVLQLKGTKRWFLYKPLDSLPNLYDDTIAALRARSPAVDTEIVLQEGDVLYVPRGVAHHADTGGMSEESIHLTIGIEIEQAHTMGRVAQELDAVCEEEGPQWSPKLSDPGRNRGLMAWHLELPNLFYSWFVESADVVLTTEAKEALEKIRVRLLEERQCFLRGRAISARAMATLHAANTNDSAWLHENKLVRASNVMDTRPTNKKSRQQ